MLIKLFKDKLDDLAFDLAVAGGATFQAIDELKDSLEQVKKAIHGDFYHKASALGYKEVSSSYIFLQRMLGEICSLADKRDSIVSECALELQCTYEEAQERLKVYDF